MHLDRFRLIFLVVGAIICVGSLLTGAWLSAIGVVLTGVGVVLSSQSAKR